MKKIIIAVCLMGLPLVGMAQITINAYAQDGAIAYLYTSDGTTYGTANFSGGVAIIPTSGLTGAKEYGLAISYSPDPEPGKSWYSQIAWGDLDDPYQYKTLTDSSVYVVHDAVTGEVGSRLLGTDTASVTLSANGPVGIYDNETNELDAQLSIYRSVACSNEVISGQVMKRTWNGDYLGSDWGWEVSPAGFFGLSKITLTNSADTFHAEYIGTDLGGGVYELQFLNLDSGTAYADGSIVSNGNDVVFTVNGLNPGIYHEDYPYYVVMDRAWIYDEDDNYSEAYDTGMSLTEPDLYIPEPMLVALLLGPGGGLLVLRRFFMTLG